MADGKLAVLLTAQCCLCALWAGGAWFYFHKQPIDACEAKNGDLRQQVEALSAREELRATEVGLLRGDYAAAYEHLPRARVHARQAGYAMDPDFDDVEGMLCDGTPQARERIALMATRFLQREVRRGATALSCQPPTGGRVVAVAGKSQDAARTEVVSKAAAAEEAAAGAVVASAPSRASAAVAISEVAESSAVKVRRGAVAAVRSEHIAGAVKVRHHSKRTHSSAKLKVASSRSRSRTRGVVEAQATGTARAAASESLSVEADASALAEAKSKIIAALLQHQREVRSCIVGNESERVNVTIRLTVSAAGQVTSKKIETSITGASGDSVRSCVDGVIQKIRFPAVTVPEVRLVQSWTWRIAA